MVLIIGEGTEGRAKTKKVRLRARRRFQKTSEHRHLPGGFLQDGEKWRNGGDRTVGEMKATSVTVEWGLRVVEVRLGEEDGRTRRFAAAGATMII